MELPASVTGGLGLLGNKAHFATPAAGVALTKAAVSVLLKVTTEAEAVDGEAALKGVDRATLKQAYAALVSLLLEAAKHNKTEADVKAALEDAKVSEDRAGPIAAVYAAEIVELRTVLSSTGFGFPHVVDADWRLDYYMKDNQLEKVNQPVYLIRLKTEQNGGKGPDVQFSASLEELQDLVNTLKDASRNLKPVSI
ncbi:HCaRG family protein [Capsaspora owczarzaki ATCC 30864]|uniref:COMM domain-containing protein 3 n=1 Tax=Capsaspora owczarzaki (strain ATCC 30864) TaxID=595528 RepID=A0A0D2VH72_CAPO3|nr:HCaRG family protein [Capsaspora owczarzaki ATCC 30864]KJE89287.1 HCaRG family protein [Capsaspora owczarzaki ATCC 30864]|eukprot:XP_004365659.1 HCaRG family protein [Capsaspora owczarzaki ATCC 30864]